MKKRYLIIVAFILFMLFSCKGQTTYTITWQNDDGSILKIDENIALGEMPSYSGNTPFKMETDEFYYTFLGWSPEITIVDESKTYIATFSEHKKVIPLFLKPMMTPF